MLREIPKTLLLSLIKSQLYFMSQSVSDQSKMLLTPLTRLFRFSLHILHLISLTRVKVLVFWPRVNIVLANVHVVLPAVNRVVLTTRSCVLWLKANNQSSEQNKYCCYVLSKSSNQNELCLSAEMETVKNNVYKRKKLFFFSF